MQEWVFCFDPEKELWQECQNLAARRPDIADIPLIPVVNLWHQRTGENWRKAWCEKHHAYEVIQRYEADGLTTEAGCRLEGISVPMTNYVSQTDYSYDTNKSSLTVRWLVRHRPEEREVLLKQGTAYFMFAWEKNRRTGEFAAVPSIGYCSERDIVLRIHETDPKNCPQLPYPILLCVLKALQKDAASLYGFSPQLLMPPTDREGYDQLNRDTRTELWLEAFLNRPLDMNIFFFRKYFRNHPEFDFDALFPSNRKENFPQLAKVFCIEPTDGLRRMYKKNPLSIIFRLMLPELGIKNEDLIRKFDYLHSFCGKTMKQDYRDRLFFDPLHRKETAPQNDEAKDYENLRFYARWLSKFISEEELAHRFLSAQKNWRNSLYTAMEFFREYFTLIPEDWKKEILRDGLTLSMRDKLGVFAQEQTAKKTDFHYSDKIRSWERKVNDYNFRLISSISQFMQIAYNLSISHGMEPEKMPGSDTSLFVMERNGRRLACIWMQGKTVQHVSFVEYRNKILEAKCRIVFLYWLKHHGLELKYAPTNEDTYRALKQEFIVEPVDRDEEWNRLSLMEMAELPQDRVRPGYYLSYYRKLTECNLMRPHAPSLHEDEQEYLSRKFVWGKPIFDAAFRGNAEAQYAMSLFYRDGIGTAWPDRRLSDAWYRRAVDSGWLRIAPATKDVNIKIFQR